MTSLQERVLEDFRKKFLKDEDFGGETIPNLNVSHGPLAYIGDLENFLLSTITQVEAETLGRVLPQRLDGSDPKEVEAVGRQFIAGWNRCLEAIEALRQTK